MKKVTCWSIEESLAGLVREEAYIKRISASQMAQDIISDYFDRQNSEIPSLGEVIDKVGPDILSDSAMKEEKEKSRAETAADRIRQKIQKPNERSQTPGEKQADGMDISEEKLREISERKRKESGKPVEQKIGYSKKQQLGKK